MQFNDTTNKSGIIQMIEKTTGMGSAAISGVTAEMAYFTNLVNVYYRIAAFFAWKADKKWTFDDTNYTTFPPATTTIVDNQRDYALPSTALRIKQVEIKGSSGDYYSIPFIHEDSSILQNEKEQEESGTPIGYRLVGQSIILYPAPDTSVITASAGLRVTPDREVDEFTTADTTQEPGLPKQFHPILYYGPSFEWAMVKGLSSIAQLCQKMLGDFPGLTQMLGDHFANRNQDKVNVLARKQVNYK